jgi:hypothetical protein
MASNFKILIRRKADRIHLRLYGDLDGSSAYELINLLRKYGHSASKIHIHTQGLNQIHPFGLNIFKKSFRIINDCTDRIAFSGDKAPDFAEPRVYTSL